VFHYEAMTTTKKGEKYGVKLYLIRVLIPIRFIIHIPIKPKIV